MGSVAMTEKCFGLPDDERQIPWVDERLRAWAAWSRCGKPAGPSGYKSCLEQPIRAANKANLIWSGGEPVRDVPASDIEAQAVEEALGLIGPQHRQVIRWRYLLCLTVFQVAKRGNCSMRTANRRIVKAQQAISARLKP